MYDDDVVIIHSEKVDEKKNIFPKLFFEMLTKTALIQQNILGQIIANLS